MRRFCILVTIFTLLGFFCNLDSSRGQGALMPSTGWGSLTGKVTLGPKSEIPDPAKIDLTPIMNNHRDKACCLAGKPMEKVDQTWIVDPKTRAIANVVVWIKPPPGQYFPTAEKYKQRKDEVVIDQPHCSFIPRVSAINPSYFDGTKDVPTGQPVKIKNSATVQHNVRAVGHPDVNPGFNKTMLGATDMDLSKSFKPQLFPISLNCDFHPWMAGKLFVFGHPYYALTKEDGTFEMPIVPAGATVTFMAWHEGKGWAIPEGKAGKALMLNAGPNVVNFEIEK